MKEEGIDEDKYNFPSIPRNTKNAEKGGIVDQSKDETMETEVQLVEKAKIASAPPSIHMNSVYWSQNIVSQIMVEEREHRIDIFYK